MLERAAGHACGPYRVPVVDVEALAAYTNNPPCGAMRGFGVPQAAFAIEGCLDLLAKDVGLDGWEIRSRNAVSVGDAVTTGQLLEKSVGLSQTLDVKDANYGARRAGRSVGIACGLKNSGIGNGVVEWGKCRLVVEENGSVSLYNGNTEMGQGLLTVLVQFAVEVTGLPRVCLPSERRLHLRARLRPDDGFAGDALRRPRRHERRPQAAGRARRGLQPRRRRAEDQDPHVLRLRDAGRDPGRGRERRSGRRRARRRPRGEPLLCRGQIEGAIHMGLGYALTEELPCEDGMQVTSSLREIGVLRSRDMPQSEVILVEEPEPGGPFGAKGVGEIGLVPTAAAVAGALEAFDGIRRTTLPMRDSPAARALSVGRIHRPRDDWH